MIWLKQLLRLLGFNYKPYKSHSPSFVYKGWVKRSEQGYLDWAVCGENKTSFLPGYTETGVRFACRFDYPAPGKKLISKVKNGKGTYLWTFEP